MLILAHNGYDVVLPEQNCCGLPMQSNGEFDAARSHACRNLDHLAQYARAGDPHCRGEHVVYAQFQIRLPRDFAARPSGSGRGGGKCVRHQRVFAAAASAR
ncbi:hypothetical protein [Candidatus Flexifilum breve]|uniref:hypothetical protein n=1 Tax=Candidatus Flexifilum breve TaxID=3140694 RepID=UPI0031CCCB51